MNNSEPLPWRCISRCPPLICWLSCFFVKDKGTPATGGSGGDPLCQGYTDFLAVQASRLNLWDIVGRRPVEGQWSESWRQRLLKDARKWWKVSKTVYESFSSVCLAVAGPSELCGMYFIGLVMHHLIQSFLVEFTEVKFIFRCSLFIGCIMYSGGCCDWIKYKFKWIYEIDSKGIILEISVRVDLVTPVVTVVTASVD